MRLAPRACLLFSLALTVPTASARTWNIEPDGTGDAPTIQAGIDSAAVGDTVSLADGAYRGPGNWNVEFRGKAITVRSRSGDPDDCTIACESHPPLAYRRGFRFASGEGPASVLEGIGITGGDCIASNGGAVQCLWGASPTFLRCRFFSNHSLINGGALMCDGGSPSFIECVFDSNTATYAGGAFYGTGTSPLMDRCVFRDNSAPREGGGAFFSDGSLPVLTECEFIGNHGQHGGGLYAKNSDPTVVGSLFQENGASDVGGGIILKDAVQPLIDSCRFESNHAAKGGGIASWEALATPEIRNCTFVDNVASSGGGLLAKRSTPTVTGCTFHGNRATWGSGIDIQEIATPTVENTIVAFGLVGAAVYCQDAESAVTLICDDLYGNAGGDWVGCAAGQEGGNGNLYADPLFCDAPGGDLRLDAASPCQDAPGCGRIGAGDVGCGVPTDVADTEARPIGESTLLGSPNPAAGAVTLRYRLAVPGPSTIRVYDVRGRIVRAWSVTAPAGQLLWDGTDGTGRPVGAGVYFVRISGLREMTARVTLLR